jgi:hypothetical protein
LAWLDANCGADGWTWAPSSTRGVVNDALAIYFADVTIANAFAAVRQWDVDDGNGWFSAAYARARRQQVEAWSDELLKIADDPRLEPNARRVRRNTRKWLISKINPARYGDKVQVAGDPDNPVRHMVGLADLSRLSDPELDALERFTDARLAAKDVQDHGD